MGVVPPSPEVRHEALRRAVQTLWRDFIEPLMEKLREIARFIRETLWPVLRDFRRLEWREKHRQERLARSLMLWPVTDGTTLGTIFRGPAP